MKITEYLALDGTEIAKLVNRKEISKQEVVKASYAQLNNVNDQLNAVTHMRTEKVMEEISTSVTNNDQYEFNGVPIFLKDGSQSIVGEPSTSGAHLFEETVASQTSHFVDKLQKSGFILLGHSTTPEFALKNITESKLHGPTRNPWNKRFSPGGSSGGAASLVASGVVPIAGASDGGGSIRIPASFTSLFGLKPTRGRTPVGPGVGRQWHGAAIDFALTRTVRDSARLLTIMQTVQQEAAFQTPIFPRPYEFAMQEPFERPLKIGFTTASPVGTPVSSEANKAVNKVITWLEEQGHSVEEAAPDIDGVQLMRDYYLMNSGEIAALTYQLEKMYDKKLNSKDVEIETWLLHLAGQNVSAAEFSLSLASWDIAAAKMATYHEKFDLFITPATAYPAPEIGELTHSKTEEAELLERIQLAGSAKQQEIIYEMFLPSLTYTPFTQLANLTGQPAVSVPVHMTEEGLPLGVQIMAAKGNDHQLLQLASQLEETNLWIGMKGNPYFM